MTQASVRRPSQACSGDALFQALQVRQHIVDLVGLEPELRHGWMPRDDAFGKRLLQLLDWIFLVQVAEGRGDCQRAWRYLVDRMAARAIGEDKVLAALLCGGNGERYLRHDQGGGQAAEKMSHCARLALIEPASCFARPARFTVDLCQDA